MVTKEELKKLEKINESIFVDFPFITENDIDNGDSNNIKDIFPEEEFLEKLKEKLNLEIKELYDIQDFEDDEETYDKIIDFLVEFVNKKNIQMVDYAVNILNEN